MNTREIAKKDLLDLFEVFETSVDMLSVEQITLVRFFQNTPIYRVIAKMAGVNEATIARRLKKIARRISSDDFTAALSLKDDVPPEKIKIIRNHFVNGMSARAIAKNTGLSYYKINIIIREMRNL